MANDSATLLPLDKHSSSINTKDINDLYRQHQPWLMNWLRGKIACPQDAGDVTQDTFVKIMAGDDVVLREPRAYLLVVANRLLINRFRRNKVEKEVLQKVADVIEVLNNDVDQKGPADIVAAQDLLRRVLLMLMEELPEKPRTAYLMARVDGLSYRQIAAYLEVSESSVKQYIARVIVHCHHRFYDDL